MEHKKLLPQLEEIQKEEGYIPETKIVELSHQTKIPIAKIYETITFYSFLTTKKGGKYVIRVCNSPSCFINGSKNIISYLQELLKIDVGQTTKDGKFSLEVTSCIGCCDSPPALMIGDQLYKNLSKEKLKEIIEQCK